MLRRQDLNPRTATNTGTATGFACKVRSRTSRARDRSDPVSPECERRDCNHPRAQRHLRLRSCPPCCSVSACDCPTGLWLVFEEETSPLRKAFLHLHASPHEQRRTLFFRVTKTGPLRLRTRQRCVADCPLLPHHDVPPGGAARAMPPSDTLLPEGRKRSGILAAASQRKEPGSAISSKLAKMLKNRSPPPPRDSSKSFFLPFLDGGEPSIILNRVTNRDAAYAKPSFSFHWGFLRVPETDSQHLGFLHSNQVNQSPYVP